MVRWPADAGCRGSPEERVEKCESSMDAGSRFAVGSERGRAEKVRRSMRYVWPTSPQEL